MKSFIIEGNGIFSTIEKAWESVGNPKVFTIKIITEGTSNLWYWNRVPCKLVFSYEERAEGQRDFVVNNNQNKKKIFLASLNEDISLIKNNNKNIQKENKFFAKKKHFNDTVNNKNVFKDSSDIKKNEEGGNWEKEYVDFSLEKLNLLLTAFNISFIVKDKEIRKNKLIIFVKITSFSFVQEKNLFSSLVIILYKMLNKKYPEFDFYKNKIYIEKINTNE